MNVDFLLTYKTVSKYWFDRAEIGGFDTSQVFDMEEDATKFLEQFITQDAYKRMPYVKRDEFRDRQMILLYSRLEKRQELFSKKDWKKYMRMPNFNLAFKPDKFVLYGVFKSYKKHPLADTQGHFCATYPLVSSVWDCLKRQNVESGIIYAVGPTRTNHRPLAQ